MSDKPRCVVVLIGNDDVKEEDEEEDDDDEEEEHRDEQEYDNETDEEEEDGDEEQDDDEEEEEDGDDEEENNETQEEEDGVKIARACAQRLYDVLSHTSMFSGHQVCGDDDDLREPILLLDSSTEEIKEGIKKAVRLVKKCGADWLVIYYAGHAFCDLSTEEIVIEPKADGGEIRLEKQVKKTVREGFKDFKKKVIKTIIFADCCLDWREYEAAEDDNQLEDSQDFLKNEDFELVRSGRYGFKVRDGCLFARAIERCARDESLDNLDVLIQYVQEFAWQLSCGRLCPLSKCPNKPKFLVLTDSQRREGLLEKFHFLPFALDLWTEDELELDPQTVDRLDPEGSDIDEAVKILKSIVKEFEAKRAAFEKPWCELEAIVKCCSLNHFEEYLKTLEIPVRDVSELDPENVWIPENVRRAIVEVLQKKLPQFDPTDPTVGRNKNGDPDFQWEGLDTLRKLVLDIGRWYKKWEPQASETGISFLLDEEKKDKKAYSVVVKDLDVTKLPESEMKEVAEETNRLCKDLGIPGRVYLVPGSLWIIFCLNIELSKDCRRNFTASLKSWIDQQKQSGANGWTLAQDPCWKPLHAVPDRILELVRQVETLCATCLPARPMWLRASDLRNLVAETMRERKLEEWRVVVLEGLMERSGDSWLQGTGTLGCYLLEHFEDERLDHRMQEIANLACKRKRSMRPEVQALVFLLQRAQQELTDEEWTQVVDSARVCYEHLKTVLCRVMLDKDADLIVMNDIVDATDWEFADSGPVKDRENPSGSNGRDAAAAATAASDSSGSGGFMRGWISGLNHIADQLAWSPSSRQVFLSSEGLVASFHEISGRF